MSDRTTSRATRSATFTQDLEVGATLFDWLDGQTTETYGQHPLHASHFRSQGDKQDLTTRGIYGQRPDSSSRSEGLQSSLENRLRTRLGLREPSVIWKPWNTPWGQYLSKPESSGPSTVGLASGSLPTPSGTSNHRKNHVAGRLDEWGGSSNPFRGTSLGRVHCPAFELWVMGYPETWVQLMPPATPSSRRSRPK